MAKRWLLVISILILAAFLRFYDLDKVPPALFGDEVDVGYQAYSILKTGKDLYGNFLPVYIRAFAEYRAPLYIYSAVPTVGVFGLNAWGVRIPAAFWGVISVLGLYLLTGRLFNRRVALVAAGLLAISPWHLQYSRASFEVTMLSSFLIFATYSFLLGVKKEYFWVLSAILFGLTIYIYSTAVVFVPFLMLLLAGLYRRQLMAQKKIALFSVLALVLVLLPALWSVYRGEARERFSLVSIFQDTVLLDKINIARRGEVYYTPEGLQQTIDPKMESLFHNKLTVFGQVFTLNYLRAFSPNFLFAEGDPNFRHSIHEMGLLYTFEAVLILSGLLLLLTRVRSKEKFVILGWLALAPVPAALTFDGGFHATRLFFMTVPFAILASLGVWWLVSLWTSNKFKVPLLILGVVAFANISFYLHRYYVHYPVESWRWWHTGFREALQFVSENQSKYQTVVINNSFEPTFERYLFYSRYDPSLLHRQFQGEKWQANIVPGVHGFTLDGKVNFGILSDEAKDEGGFEKVLKPGMLYLASVRDEAGVGFNTYEHQNFRILKTIVNPAGDPILYLLEGK